MLAPAVRVPGTLLVCLIASTAVLPVVPVSAAAKPCPRLCREDMAGCQSRVASALACQTARGPARRGCLRALRPERKRCRRLLLDACRADPTAGRCLAPGGVPVPTPTAWEALLAEIERTGEITVDTARVAFSLAFAPLPGVTLPPGATAGMANASGHDTGDVGGCAALRWIRAHWQELTDDERALVEATLRPSNQTPSSAHTRAPRPVPAAPDGADLARFRGLVDAAVAAIATRLGIPLVVPIDIIFMDPAAKPGAPAALDAVDSNDAQNGPLARCRMYVSSRVRADPDSTSVRGTITHETFHCFQAQLSDLARYYDTTAPQWLDEGSANWVAADIVGRYAGIESTWGDWFRKPEVPLDRRTYSGMGIFAEAAWLGATVYTLFPALLRKHTHTEAFSVLSAPVAERMRRSWAGSVLRLPARGAEWDVQGMGVPPTAFAPPATTLPAGDVEAVDVAPYAASVVRIASAAPNVLVDIAGGTVRIADATGRDVVAPPGTFLCTAPPCRCDNGAAAPGTTIDVALPLDVAITGWTTGARGALAGVTVTERCQYDPTNATGFCRALQPLTTLGPALVTALLEGTADDLRAAWGPWNDTIVQAGPVPPPVATAWASVIAYQALTTDYYDRIAYDIDDAVICSVGESPDECAAEVLRSEAYAEAVNAYVPDLKAADAYLREVCDVTIILEPPP